MITENQINLLRFEKNMMKCYEGDKEYYYSYDIVDGLSLITNTSKEAEKDGWIVEIFNVEPGIRFSDFVHVQSFINNMESKIVKK